MKKILVTGGAGFIGAHLVEKLLNLKHKVMVVDSLKKTSVGIPYINPKCFFVKGDILKEEVLKKIKKWKPTIVYHLAAQVGSDTAYDNPKFDYLTNGYGTYLLSLLSKEIKIKHFIYTSSVAVYGSSEKVINEKSKIKPDSIYGVSKYAGEMFIGQVFKKSKIKTSIFRVFNTYGPGENLNNIKKGMVSIYCSYLWKNKPIVVKGSLKRFRNYQYIDDVVNILTKSILNKKLNKNEIFNLTNGKILTVKKLIGSILYANNLKKYKIKIHKHTKGDSFGFNSSSYYLESKFDNYKFISIVEGLKKYFKWINKIPNNKNINKHHPLKLKNIN